MIDGQAHVDGEAMQEAEDAPRKRMRTCVGCGEPIDLSVEGGDLVRLILGPEGEIAVDAGARHGGGFGRGAHVHTRPDCLERAARAGLLRVTKGKAHLVLEEEGGAAKRGPLSAGSLARAIQRAMDRRIEGLLAAAVRSRQVARGSDAVVGACRRGEAELVVVACDAAAAADLTEVRRAVADGRAVAWGTKQRLGAIAPGAVRGRLGDSSRSGGPRPPQGPAGVRAPGVEMEASALRHPAQSKSGAEGVGVVAVTSRTIAEALRRAVQAADRVSAVEEGRRPRGPSGSKPPRGGPNIVGEADQRSEGREGSEKSPDRRRSRDASNVERGA